ncbi:hypothetical protein JL36_08500 [Lactococcus cremoris]|nr:hypothetical protein JL36_08500 [Lactococcus cremoris]
MKAELVFNHLLARIYGRMGAPTYQDIYSCGQNDEEKNSREWERYRLRREKTQKYTHFSEMMIKKASYFDRGVIILKNNKKKQEKSFKPSC